MRLVRDSGVSILFLLLICGVPVIQAAWEWSEGEPVQALDVVGPLEEPRLRQFEDDLRRVSLIDRIVVPWYQWGITALFGRGNEKAIEGRDGWLYYRDDLQLVVLPGLPGTRPGGDAAVRAIVEFRDQLAEQGVELLVVPVPPKTMVDPSRLSSWTSDLTSVRNPETPAFFSALARKGVACVYLSALFDRLREARGDPREPLYLERDTHWTPATMSHVAEEIAREARAALGDAGGAGGSESAYATEPGRVSAPGDIAVLIRLPEGRRAFEPMELDVERVTTSDGTRLVDRDSDVLLLGDSFTLAFSDPQFGLGEGAGLVEHLARALERPIDVIAMAGGSARAVRESLARRARGLEGKKLVIWQISMRELLGGEEKWARVELGGSDPGNLPAASASRVELVGEVVEVSPIPERFSYDLCLAIYEYRVIEVLSGDVAAGPVWVAHAAIEDYRRTSASRFEVGARHRLVLEPVEDHHDLERTAWVDETDAGSVIHWAIRWETVE